MLLILSFQLTTRILGSNILAKKLRTNSKYAKKIG